MPINRQYPIKELLAACRAFPGAKANNKIAFEYVMLKGARVVEDFPFCCASLVAMSSLYFIVLRNST